MLSDLESKMGPSHLVTLLLRTQLEEAWRPPVRSETSCSNHCITLRREQESELTDLSAQVAADLPVAAATPVSSEEGRKTTTEALDALSKGEGQLQEHMRGALVPRRRRPPAPAAASTMDTDLDEVVRKRKDTLDGLLSNFEFEGETEEVKRGEAAAARGVQENAAGMTALGNSKRRTSRVAADSRRGSRKLPLTWSSSKNTYGRHRGYMNSGLEFARKGGM